MKKSKPKACAECGGSLVRTQLRPPVYQCMTCAPLRADAHCREWASAFDHFYERMAAAIASKTPYARPPWCFVETNRVAQVLRHEYMIEPDGCAFYMHQGAGLLAWRAAKSVYRLHPSLLTELLDTPVTGALPVESLMRMPVWCPYVECDLPVLWGCDAKVAADHRIVGMFAYLDFLPLFEPTIPTLRLLLDVVDLKNPNDFEPGLMMSTQLALEPGLTVDESIARVDEFVDDEMREFARHFGESLRLKADDFKNGDLPETFRGTVRRLLSVLLYLCAENAEVDKRAAPAPCRVIAGPRGPRLFEPPEVAIVRCGVHVGEQLRRAREAHERTKHEAPRGTVAPHIRRGSLASLLEGAARGTARDRASLACSDLREARRRARDDYGTERAAMSDHEECEVLIYELDPDRAAPRCCFLCLDDGATLVVRRESQSFGHRAICTECVSCLVTAGLQGRVARHMDSDDTHVPQRS